MSNYLEISRASDIENKRERVLYRFFEILPGAISLTTLTFALLFSWLKPVWVAFFIIPFCLYWVLKVGYLSLHQIACFRRMKKNLKIDWQKKLENIDDWRKIYQLVILPMYKENWEVVKESLESLKNSNYPKNKMIVILAQEERAGKTAKEIGELAREEYGKCFYRFLTTCHPKDIEGEAIGKGSNTAFAGKEAKKLIDNLKIPYQNIIVSTFDIDTKVFPQYFLCLTYHYLTSKNPLRQSFQPIPVYHNNIWQAPAFSRVVACNSTFWQMMQQERPEQLVTYSSHSMPFKTFLEVGYPCNLVSDDSRIFWKSFFKYDGNYQVVPLYYPVSMDVVDSSSFFKTFANQYKQQRRWAWGCIEIPYLLFGFLKNKKIPLRKKIFYSSVAIEGFWSWACASLLILFLGWLPLVLGGEEFNITILAYNLPRLTGIIMSFAMFGMICAVFLNILFLPPRPPGTSRLKKFSMIFQWLFLPPVLIIFGSFPAFDAQIRLMFGKYLEFWNTPKIRKNYSK
ncbi:glycosyltransferase family 2 protein [bacterium]|nr:glycosyltransferase family 2 protein [bacterium]